MKQLHIFFSGQVQGVGFRYRAKEIADSLKIAGFVKNLSDGRVELVIQGDKKMLESLVSNLKREFVQNIKKTEISWDNDFQKLSNFEIRY